MCVESAQAKEAEEQKGYGSQENEGSSSDNKRIRMSSFVTSKGHGKVATSCVCMKNVAHRTVTALSFVLCYAWGRAN